MDGVHFMDIVLKSILNKGNYREFYTFTVGSFLIAVYGLFMNIMVRTLQSINTLTISIFAFCSDSNVIRSLFDSSVRFLPRGTPLPPFLFSQSDGESNWPRVSVPNPRRVLAPYLPPLYNFNLIDYGNSRLQTVPFQSISNLR